MGGKGCVYCTVCIMYFTVSAWYCTLADIYCKDYKLLSLKSRFVLAALRNIMFAFQIWACSGEQKKQSETELLTVIIKQIQKTLSMVCKTQQKGGKKMNNPPSANTAATSALGYLHFWSWNLKLTVANMLHWNAISISNTDHNCF